MGRGAGKIIEKIRIDGVSELIEIRMVKEYGKINFFSNFGEKSFSGTDIQKVIQDVTKCAKETININWIPIIEIEVGDSQESFGHGTKVSFDFSRYYFGIVGERVESVKWSMIDNKVFSDADILRSSRNYKELKELKDGFPMDEPDRRTYYRPYSEKLWAGLERMREMLVDASKRLNELVGSEAGIKKIMSGGALMLTADAGKKS